MFKGLGQIASLMKNAQEISSRAEEMKAKLKDIRVEGTAGGGMVKAEATGDQRIVSLTIEESVMQSGDREMLEDLVVAATNQALDAAKEAAALEMSQLTEGMGIPGMEEAFSKFGFGN